MPLYEFHCADCGTFTQLRRIADREQPAHCPGCGVECRRIVSLPRLAVQPAQLTRAMERNERSAHEPRQQSGRQGHVCSAGCSHRRDAPPAPKRPARPWMLGH